MGRTILLGFVAGFAAVLVFHQGTAWLLHMLTVKAQIGAGVFGRVPFPFNMAPVRPFGVPQVVSWAFWGGVWGIVLGLILARARGPKFWVLATVIGAIAPTLVAILVVAPLKGMPRPANPAPLIAVGLIVNAVWGFATAAFYRLMERR